ncbi:MAG: metallophosphoesterase family protein [Actinobacteria bacterium]|nr:metallophosphoesterase family protein [Thermoleophilia bacterium]MCB9010985.1 metallophosphoesterase family protein [Actinomycetota bacterium]
METTRIAVLSDTHFPARGSHLPERCVALIQEADMVIHAGDHADLDAVAALRALGTPVVAVHGNVDTAQVCDVLPRHTSVRAHGQTIAVVHDAGLRDGRLERLRRAFPDADGVIFGHSHIPLVERAPDGFFILNPGSATDRRRQPHHTMATLVLHADRPAEIEIIVLDGP